MFCNNIQDYFMKRLINIFRRMLAVLLCAGLIAVGCVECPAVISLDKVTATTATFTGHLNVAFSDLPVSQVIVYYSDAETFNMNAAKKYVFAALFDDQQNFTLTLKYLKDNTRYNYCVAAKVKSEETFGEVRTFTTLPNPYTYQADLSVSSAIDLSSSGFANCYVVSSTGTYKFKPVKGNSITSVGSVSVAETLWETFGISTEPQLGDLISAITYKNGYIAFQTADTFQEGNAVIAAKDTSGTILWSWHIWFTDPPQGQEYYNNAGIMMDRNLGATSATPDDVGALGLLYQWGRKDPFLGSSSISSNTMAKSTITWPSAVSSDSSNGTIEYATAHPTTFITYNTSNWDWYYTGSSSIDDTRWTTSDKPKSIYDPCPSGWRVPDGGKNGVWSKALGLSSSFDNCTNNCINFSGKFGSASTIWYPASGCLDYHHGDLCLVGHYGRYWSASPYRDGRYYASCLNFSLDYFDFVFPSHSFHRAEGHSVRCVKE